MGKNDRSNEKHSKFELLVKERLQANDELPRKIKSKDRVKIGFQVIHSSMWKYDWLYRLLAVDPSYEPFLIICPNSKASTQEMVKEYETCRDLCTEKGYAFVDTKRGCDFPPLDIALGSSHPDVVFLQNAWEKTLPQHSLFSWKRSLLCYVPYFFTLNTLMEYNYGKLFHSMLWSYFVESHWHKEQAKKYSAVGGRNVTVVGYPGLDEFLFSDQSDRCSSRYFGVTKPQKKRVIYAPHHTISSATAGLAYSTFEKYSDFMQQTAQVLNEQIEFVFKPHPLLFDRLCRHPEWGAARARNYWKKWEEMTGCRVVESTYSEVFLESDALIHDCNSFLAEYLTTGKPSLFLLNDDRVSERINEFGRRLYMAHYHAKSKEDIKRFLLDIVLNDNDPMYFSRQSACNDLLIPPNGITASQNIIEFFRKNFES